MDPSKSTHCSIHQTKSLIKKEHDMDIFRKVNPSFWTDSKIYDTFSSMDKLLYLFLLTNPCANLCGCYELSLDFMADTTGCSTEDVLRGIDRLSKTYHVISYNEDTHEILIFHWSRYNWTSSPKFRAALAREVSTVKSPAFRSYLTCLMEDGDVHALPDTQQSDMENAGSTEEASSASSDIVIVARDGSIAEEVTESSSVNQGFSHSREKFIPPQIEDVKNYVSKMGYQMDAEHFYDYYQSNGWKVGPNPMNDWKASVRSWNAREKDMGWKEKTGKKADPITELMRRGEFD